jgi:hypothetical protein
MVISDALPVQFWSVLTDTYNEKTNPGIYNKCFCAPWEAGDEINIQFDFNINDTFYLKVYNSEGTILQTFQFTNTIGSVYYYSFSPILYSISDELISLSIFQNSTELFKSDCLDIKPEWDETVLIEYSSSRNFASLNYTSVSPDPEFYIRIPAIFFQERFPEEGEVIELSNSRSIQLNAQIKAQRLLRIKDMPAYMHRKLKLVLIHQNITIDLQDWVKEGGQEYELVTSSNPRWPMQRAQVWLTEKDYIIRNVL